ncbi:MAG: universal stress protein, partial [Gammaproteobacteria bacterium]
MADYRHILLAADFSEHGEYAARKSQSLANIYRAKLSVIHVLDNIPMPDTAYGTVISLNERTDNSLLEAEKIKLSQLGDRLHIHPADRWLIWGIPKQEIARLAEKEKVDLIVAGFHRLHGVGLLLGSTADGILHYAPCDVMT